MRRSGSSLIITNLISDPHEREASACLPHPHSLTEVHFNRLVGSFKTRFEQEPLIAAAHLEITDRIARRTGQDLRSATAISLVKADRPAPRQLAPVT